MSLKQQILDDIKTAMKAREQAKLGVLRMLSAAIKQKEIDSRTELCDAEIVSIVEKQIKQRKEAATQFEQGGRSDSAQNELAEAETLASYLPAQLTQDEVQAIIRDAVAKLGASGPADMGKVMGAVKPLLTGKADMSQVSGQVKSVLSGL